MTTVQDGLEMLVSEHRFVEGLLARLEGLAEKVAAGEAVSPRDVRVGVGLLDAYLHRVHMRQFDVDLWPDAKGVARPECHVSLEHVREAHNRMRHSAHAILELASRWAKGEEAVRAELSRGLRALVASDLATNEFEELRPFACLSSALSATAREKVGEMFASHAGAKHALEANIDRYLQKSDPCRCPGA